MRKESKVSARASIVMRTGTGALLLLTLGILSTCVNIKTVKIPEEYRSADNRIAIAPVEFQSLSLITKELNLEVGIRLITGEPDPWEVQQRIIQTLNDWHPEIVLHDNLVQELTKRGRRVIQADEIIPLPEKIRAQLSPDSENSEGAQLWYKPDVTVFDHSRIVHRHNPTAIMEAGYESIALLRTRTLFVVLIKVVDPSSSKVIARKRKVVLVGWGKYNIRDPIGLQQYAADFKTNFDKAVAKATSKALDDIGL
jgi:hypothetical protein